MLRSKPFLLLGFCLLLFCQPAFAGWVKQRVNSFAWFQGVYFLNENKGWIVGSRGTILATQDGGGTWQKIVSGTDDTIKDVHFFDEQNGWLLCERDRYQLGSNAPSYLLKTTDGGGHWDQVELGGSGSPVVVSLFFDKDKRGWAVGEGGAVYSMLQGENWRKRVAPTVFAVMDGAFSSESNGCLVGGGGTILFTEDGGQLWNYSTVFSKSETKLNSVFFTDQRNGWTVGSQGKIYATTNGGKSWRPQLSSVTADLFDVTFINTSDGWAVGANGTLLRTQSGGRVWASLSSGVPHKLERVFFLNRDKGWVVGFGGTVLKYQAGN
jgi:photosystem II stability/assembly factor-like uncharacterized protein